MVLMDECIPLSIYSINKEAFCGPKPWYKETSGYEFKDLKKFFDVFSTSLGYTDALLTDDTAASRYD